MLHFRRFPVFSPSFSKPDFQSFNHLSKVFIFFGQKLHHLRVLSAAVLLGKTFFLLKRLSLIYLVPILEVALSNNLLSYPLYLLCMSFCKLIDVFRMPFFKWSDLSLVDLLRRSYLAFELDWFLDPLLSFLSEFILQAFFLSLHLGNLLDVLGGLNLEVFFKSFRAKLLRLKLLG